MNPNDITSDIIKCSIEIHKTLGPGLMEKAYQEFIYHELAEMGYYIEKEKTLPVVYKGIRLELGYRMDLIVEDQVIVEVKRVETLTDVHTAQILTYMKLGGYNHGLIINFQNTYLKNGIKRFVL